MHARSGSPPDDNHLTSNSYTIYVASKMTVTKCAVCTKFYQQSTGARVSAKE